MREIPLTRGKVAIVDDEDFERLNEHKWCFNKYATRCDKEKSMYMHREILGITERTIFVDHINRDRLDNRKENLRSGRCGENLANRGKPSNNVSGYKGVSRNVNKVNVWSARIVVNYKCIHIGVFDNKEEAAKAYNKAAIKYFGEFAMLNEV